MPAQVATMPKPQDQSVRIAADVLQMARTIVSVSDVTISELIAETCRPIFRKRIEQLQREGRFLPKPDQEE